jgi:prolyl-tRNA synthetase
MRISKSFFKTEKNAPSKAFAESHKLLFRGGFIRQVTSGRNAFLPLGMRARNNIVKIIEDELRATGAQQVELPLVQPIETRAQINQDKTRGHPQVIAEDRFGEKSVLNEASECLAAKLFGSLRPSYKDLAIHVYQFLPKFRDAISPRDGLIQAYEYLANESYSFERDEQSLDKACRDTSRAYDRIFRSIGLELVPVIVKGSSREDDFSLRFMLLTPQMLEKLDIYWDEEEEIEKMEDVDCSLDYKLYRRILRFYSQHPEKTLKNMIYKIDEKDHICITIRGDYKIDFKKVKKLLNCTLIRPVTTDEINRLSSHPGFISSIGLDKKVKVLVDESVEYNKNYWDGGNKERAFKKNVNFDRDFEVKETVDVREDKIYAAGSDQIVTCDSCDYRANLDEAEFVREEVNLDEEMKEFMMIDQPEWVCTMDDNVEHYKKSKSHFLKNVVYKDARGRLIIAIVRGDLEANPAKISKILDCGNLELAEDEDFDRINTLAGWVHSWGHDEGRKNVVYICDEALKVSRNLIGGYKEKDRDAFNVNYGRDFTCTYEGDIVNAYSGAKCKRCENGYLRERKGMELARIFKHRHSYSAAHEAYFIDRDGKEKAMWIGISRIDIGGLLAGVVEVHHDERGIIWPKSIAPFLISLVTIGQSQKVMEESQKVYEILSKQGWEVLWDDRENASPGEKLMDADLIGNPIRVLVSERSLKKNCLEIKLRSGGGAEYVELGENLIIAAIRRFEKKLDETEQKSLNNPSTLLV